MTEDMGPSLSMASEGAHFHKIDPRIFTGYINNLPTGQRKLTRKNNIRSLEKMTTCTRFDHTLYFLLYWSLSDDKGHP